ncbi:MAG: hypothetical protein H7832_04100 [Magnetococcus sp. DMHC-6]
MSHRVPWILLLTLFFLATILIRTPGLERGLITDHSLRQWSGIDTPALTSQPKLLQSIYSDEKSHYAIVASYAANSRPELLRMMAPGLSLRERLVHLRHALLWVHPGYPLSFNPVGQLVYGVPVILWEELFGHPTQEPTYFLYPFFKIGRWVNLILAGWTGLVLLHLWRRYYGPHTMGLTEQLSAMFLGVAFLFSPLHLAISPQVTYNILDVLLQLLFFLSCLKLVNRLQENPPDHWSMVLGLAWPTGVWLGLALATKWSALPLIGVVGLGVLLAWWLRPTRHSFFGPAVLGAGGAVLVVATLLYGAFLFWAWMTDTAFISSLVNNLYNMAGGAKLYEPDLAARIDFFLTGVLPMGVGWPGAVFIWIALLTMLVRFWRIGLKKSKLADLLLVAWIIVLIWQPILHVKAQSPPRNILLFTLALLLMVRAIAPWMQSQKQQALGFSLLLILVGGLAWPSIALNHFLFNDHIRDRASVWMAHNLEPGTVINVIRPPYNSYPSLMQALAPMSGQQAAQITDRYSVAFTPAAGELLEEDAQMNLSQQLQRRLQKPKDEIFAVVHKELNNMLHGPGRWLYWDSNLEDQRAPLLSDGSDREKILAAGYQEMARFSIWSDIQPIFRPILELYIRRGGLFGVEEIFFYRR